MGFRGCITKLDYDKKMQEYNDKMQLLEIELSEYGNADKEYKIVISTVFSLSKRAKEIFDSSEVHEKRQILNYLLQNSTLNEKTPCFTMRSPYNLILGLASSPDLLPVLDEFRTLNWQKIESDLRFSRLFGLFEVKELQN